MRSSPGEGAQIAPVARNLAATCRRAGDYAQAGALYHRALATAQAALGPTHPLVGDILAGLGELDRDRRDEAEGYLRRGIEILEAAGHAHLGPALNTLGMVLSAGGEHARSRRWSAVPTTFGRSSSPRSAIWRRPLAFSDASTKRSPCCAAHSI